MSRETVSAGDKLVVTNPSQIADLTAFTYAFWTYVENSIGIGTTVPRFISKLDSGSTERKRFQAANGSNVRRISGTVPRATTNASATSISDILTDATWMHLAMTFDETNGIKLFKNGVEVSYNTAPTIGAGAAIADSGGNLIFANMNSGGNTLDGRMAEIGIWNRVLSAGELNALGVKLYTPRLISAGLVGAWRLLGDTSPEPDSVNANNAAVTGMVQAAHPPGIITSLPERASRLGMYRGEYLGMQI